MTRWRAAGVAATTAVATAVVSLMAACGVSSEEEPQLVDQSTEQRRAATPSVDTETSPLPATTRSELLPPPSIRPPESSSQSPQSSESPSSPPG